MVVVKLLGVLSLMLCIFKPFCLAIQLCLCNVLIFVSLLYLIVIEGTTLCPHTKGKQIHVHNLEESICLSCLQ